jgi:hypothetical protein
MRSFKIFALCQLNQWSENQKEIDHLGGLGVDEIISFKYILDRYVVNMETGHNSLRVVSNIRRISVRKQGFSSPNE